MASRDVLLVLACFLLLNTMGGAIAPVGSPKSSPISPNYPPSPPIVKAPPQPPKTPLPPPIVKAAPPPQPPKTPLPPPIVKAPPLPPPAPVKAPPPPPPTVKPPRNRQECTPLCVVRCKLHSRPNVCMRACLTCCDRCKCVPPGYSGNKEKCGTCYAGMTTKGGKPKCP